MACSSLSAEQCSLSCSKSASMQCCCTVPPTLTCIDCLRQHVLTEGNHLVSKLQPRDSPNQAQLSNRQCQLCGEPRAQHCCLCKFPGMYLCERCMKGHISGSEREAHFMFPADFAETVTTLDQAKKARDNYVNLCAAQDFLREKISAVSECQKAISARHQMAKDALEAFVNKESRQLEALKRTMIRGAEASAESIFSQQLRTEKERDNLSTLLWKIAQSRSFKSLDVFDFTEVRTMLDCAGVVGVKWKSKIDFQETVAENWKLKTVLKSLLQLEEYKMLGVLLFIGILLFIGVLDFQSFSKDFQSWCIWFVVLEGVRKAMFGVASVCCSNVKGLIVLLIILRAMLILIGLDIVKTGHYPTSRYIDDEHPNVQTTIYCICVFKYLNNEATELRVVISCALCAGNLIDASSAIL